MVATGLGITVLPKSSVEERPRDTELLATRPFAGKPPSRRIALAWRRSFPRQKAIHALRDTILACGLKGVTLLPDARPVGE